ncbi:Choline monooxygenase [Handroanthus impetiginosus]|uniref:Choline monooxygenase, chloroplastic n=1 Tax=Handroanthus impetiginosus TaxID=429701 RepID=A0A2G9HNL4_9LAMI|nr:Choline monooxygenase [Handroanthus impetiginosus]
MAATTMLQKLAYFHHFPEFRQHQQPRFQFTRKPNNQTPFSKNYSRLHSDNGNYFPVTSSTIEEISGNHAKIRRMIQEFNPEIPIDEAFTPPSSWYTDPDFYSLELIQVFYRGWQSVGYTAQIKEPHDFFTGRQGSIEYVVCRDEKGTLHAFHNVCRHHASLLASGAGKKSCFVCPYHGWTYGLDGALVRATRITGIKNFQVNEMGLVPLKVATWGPFVLINFEGGVMPKEGLDTKAVGDEWLGAAAEILSTNGVDTSLDYVCRHVYTLECNWKVFCDNYLDGGYHVPYAHKGLASGLQLDSYSTKMYEKVSIQSCGGATKNCGEEVYRIGSEALYAFIYPNFMINRYGPWMDTNLVLPMGPRRCQVIFDYFLDSSLKDDNAFIEKSLEDSKKVQEEDIILCNAVQQGLESPAYNVGRYSPTLEMAMHHFHRLLLQNLSS